MRPIQFNIGHKGLILVAVPLVFEIAFVVCLVQMLQNADRQTAELAHSKAIIACASDLDKTLAWAGYALITYRIIPSESLIKRYDTMAAQAAQLNKKLADLGKQGSDATSKRVAQITDVSAKLLALTASTAHPQESGGFSVLNKAMYLGQIEEAYSELYDETQALTEEEEKILVGGSDQESRSRAFIYTLINIAVFFNVALTVGMAMYFSRSITRRIGVLIENTRRLALGSSLKEPVTGHDEIATLDAVFHKMATELHETEQRKQDFVSMITHDLRTPLTSMRTVSTTLAEGAAVRQDPDDSQRVQVLQRSLDRMINLVNDLLDMDKIEAGLLLIDCSPTPFAEVLIPALDSVQHLAQQRGITINCPPLDVVAEIDAKRMGQVLVNLLSNAIKYSSRGSTICVESAADNSRLTVKIIDSGRGIPREQLKQIFDRFKQVEHSDSTVRGGSGLGLFITKALVELHHGTIGVESNPGEGSTFWFKVPIKQPHVRTGRE